MARARAAAHPCAGFQPVTHALTGPRIHTRRFVVDAADQNNLEIARSELHNLLKKQDGKENPLAGIPLLVRASTPA